MQELSAIFDVIGTPEWACIEGVESERWRSFLRRLPAQAPHLMRRFGAAGEPAVDMLRRLLAFDPQRRCRPACAPLCNASHTCMQTSERRTDCVYWRLETRVGAFVEDLDRCSCQRNRITREPL